jgi:hypothetical protein
LSSQEPAPHLVEAIQKHYAVHPNKENFRTDYVIKALSELELIPIEVERETLANVAELKFERWLQMAIEKCRGSYV